MAEIRPATGTDVERLRSLYVALYEYHRAGAPDRLPTPPRPDWADTSLPEAIETRVASTEWGVFVAEERREIVGFADVFIGEERLGDEGSTRRFARIEDLWVAPDHRKSSAGSLLMEVAEAWARERGWAEVELKVWGFSRDAVRLYKRRGYETVVRIMRRRL